MGKLGACALRVLLFVVCAFVSMAAGSMSSSKHVCRCMFACTEGEVLKGRSGYLGHSQKLHAALC